MPPARDGCAVRTGRRTILLSPPWAGREEEPGRKALPAAISRILPKKLTKHLTWGPRLAMISLVARANEATRIGRRARLGARQAERNVGRGIQTEGVGRCGTPQGAVAPAGSVGVIGSLTIRSIVKSRK